MYAQGVGPVQQDKAEALKLYEKACAKGHVKAAYNLGLLYQRGDGVKLGCDEFSSSLDELSTVRSRLYGQLR